MTASKGELVRARYDDPKSFVSRLRAARAVHVKYLIKGVFAQKGKVDIMDLGGYERYWNSIGVEFLRNHNCRVTLLNLHAQKVSNDMFTSVVGDACAVERPNNSFDLVHSNSVIEHVGTDKQMAQFAEETRRLAPSYYIQTPNYWFPYEPHMRMPLIHWLPVALQRRLVLLLQLDAEKPVTDLAAASAYLQHNRIMDERKFAAYFPDGEIRREKLFGLTKSLMAIRC